MRSAKSSDTGDTGPTLSENLELVKSIYAAWERGDFSATDWADPEIEFAMVGALIEGRWRGMAEMAEAWRAMLRSWVDLKAIPSDIRELDENRVLVFLQNSGRGRASGIPVEQIAAKSANVFEVRNGKVTRLTIYWDREDAPGA
jgi:ketosteroid isomerase-like protein